MMAEPKGSRSVSFAPDTKAGHHVPKEKRLYQSIELEERLKALEQKKKQEAKIQKLQHSLLKRSVEERELQKCLLIFKPKDYKNVIIERAVNKLCGYPLCSKNVGNWSGMPKYKILTEKRKWIKRDILENYCSILCMEKSENIQKALPLKKSISNLSDEFIQAEIEEQEVNRYNNLSKDEASSLSPGSFKDALRIEGYSGIISSSKEQTVPRKVKTEDVTPKLTDPNHQESITGSKRHAIDVFAGFLDHQEEIAANIAKIKLSSFLKLWTTLSDFVDHPIDDRQDIPTLECAEIDEFSDRRLVLRSSLIAPIESILSEAPSISEKFSKQFISEFVIDMAKGFNISKPIPSLEKREWKLLVALLLRGGLERASLDDNRALCDITDVSNRLCEILVISSCEKQILEGKLQERHKQQ